MSFASSWLKRLRWMAVRRSKPIRNFCPIIEQLEDRCTPSSLPPGAIQISASPAPILGYEFTGTVGQQFTTETLYANGVNTGHTFSLPPASSGNTYSMPPGLQLTNSPGGIYSITGTPTKPGQYNVPIQVSDGGNYDSTVYQFLISPQSSSSPTTPTWSVGTTMQPLNALNALQYNNQTLPLGVVDQPYNATVTATNSSDPITGVQISTYLLPSPTSTQPPVITPVVGGSTIGGIYVQKSTIGNTYTDNIFGLDGGLNGTNGPALNVSWTKGSDQVFVTGTPTFSAAGQSYPLFLSVSFLNGPQHNFNFSFGYSPQEIESAYDFNGVGNGAGQTIVILEAGRIANLVSSTDPNFANSDLNQFDQLFPGLNTFGQPGGPVFLKVNGSGGSVYSTKLSGGDVTEEVQDIEWAHALAPLANIVDIPGNATSYSTSPTQFLQNLINQGLPTTNALTTTIAGNVTLPTSTTIDVSSTAGFPSSGYLLIQTATGTTVVNYTSLSATAFQGSTGTGGNVTFQTGEKVTLSTLYVVGTSGVGTLNNSTSQSGVTFVDSSGDDIVNNKLNTATTTTGNVVYTGYNQLTQSPTSSYASESAVFGVYDPFRTNNSPSGAGLTLGSGGSYNNNNAGSKQAFQSGIYGQLNANPNPPPSIGRTGPDVSFNGSPESGDIEFNSAINSLTNDSKSPFGSNPDFGGAPWEDAWGTSISSPSWDALFAIANQGRAALGKPSLSGYTQTLPMLYSLAGSSAFHPISTSVSTPSNTDLSISASTIPNQVKTSGGTYTSYGSGVYNTLAGLGSPVVDSLIPVLIGPTLTSNTGLWAGGGLTNATLTITGSNFSPNATYTVSFNGETPISATYISPTTLIVTNLTSLSGLAAGTSLMAVVTMNVTAPSYTDTTGAPVQVATIPQNVTNTVYVQNLYSLLLHRSPDPGAQNWINLLNAGTSPATVIQDIEQSPEYLNDLVTSLYQHYLNRAPDPGAQGWVTALENGSTIEQVIAGIVSSPEFYQDSGGTNSGYVNGLYNLILGRSADAAGAAYWTNAVTTGTSRAAVAMGFLTSTEYRQDLVAGVGWTSASPTANPPSSYFQGYYLTFLSRQGDVGGVASWLADLQAGVTDQQVLAGILGSMEGYAKWS